MDIKKTISSIFLVPILKIPKDALIDNGFLNAYSYDEMYENKYENAVFLLFKPKNLNKFRVFLDGEYNRTSIIDEYDYERGFVVIVYALDKAFIKDYKLLRESKYSKTSPEFQALFPKVIKLMKNGLHRDEISLQYRIFNKTPDLIQFWEDKFDVQFGVDQEVWGGFNEIDETLDNFKLMQYD